MRSEKVGNAIDLLQNGIADDVISYYCTRNKKRLCDNYCEKEDTDCIYNQAIETVLAYIEELEKITNEVDKQFIHKDRIYELTEEMNKQADSYNKAVDKFNKLLGE